MLLIECQKKTCTVFRIYPKLKIRSFGVNNNCLVTLAHFRCMCLHIQNSIDPAETLVYADIGPCSLKQRSHVTLLCDDDRVEYAQLNQNLLTDKSEKTKPKVEPSSVGTEQ